MSNKRIEDIIKEKLDSKQYAYEDAYWDSAKAYMASQKNGKGGFFNFLTLAAILLITGSTVALGAWYFISSESNNKVVQSASKLNDASSHNESEEKDSTARIATLTGSESKSPLSKSLNNSTADPINENISESNSGENHLIPVHASQGQSRSSVGLVSEAAKTTRAKNTSESTQAESTKKLVTKNKDNSFDANLTSSQTQRNVLKALTLESREIEEVDLELSLGSEDKNEFSLPKLNLLAVGVYGSYQWINDFKDDRYEMTNGYQFSYGAFGEYAVNNWIHLQAGAGYSTEHFNLKIDPEFAVNQLDEWDVTTINEVFYNMEFQNGVPITFDSSLVTTVDSTLNTTFDTAYTDSVFQTTQGNYRIHRIEIPLAVRFHKSFGRWEVYGATGANLGILTNINSQQSELALPNENEFNRFTVNGVFRLGASIYVNDKIRWSMAAHTNYEIVQPLKFIDNRRIFYGIHSSITYRW